MSRASQPKKKSNIIPLAGGLLLIGGIAFAVTGGGDTPTKPAAAAAAAKSTKANADTTGMLVDADYTASFKSLKITPKDAFLPLVSKGAGETPQNSGGLPLSMTGGQEWDYTGMVQVDGTPEGLLENPKSGESNYVTVGERWKKAKIKRVSDSDIELVGDDGNVAVVKMGEIASKEEKAPSEQLAPASIAGTGDGNLTGAIGSVDISPLPGVQGQGFNGGRRGRGRRNNMNGNGGF